MSIGEAALPLLMALPLKNTFFGGFPKFTPPPPLYGAAINKITYFLLLP